MTSEDRLDSTDGGSARRSAIWFRRTVALGSAGAAIIALLGLLGYVPGLRVLGNIRPDYIPMAPSTAFCFLILSLVLFRHARMPRQGSGLMAMRAMVLLIAVFGLLNVVGRLVGIDLTFEVRLVSGLGTLGKIPIGQMSPATGATFLVAGLGTFLLLLRSKSFRFGHWASSLGIVTILAGATVLLAYLYGTPLMYGGATIPMAATTASAFLFLGAALVAAVGPESFPVRLVTGDSTSARLSRVFVPLTVTVVLIQGILSRFTSASFVLNDALALAVLVIVAGTIAAFAVTRVAHWTGVNLDAISGKLRQSEQQHRTILQTAMAGFWLVDTQGRLLKVNESYCRMSGYSEQELLAMSIHDLEAAETADNTAAHIQEIMASGEARFESRHRRRDGSIIDVEISVQYRPTEGGRFVAFLQDITERKLAAQADEKLRASEERFLAFFDKGPVGYQTLDGEGRVIETNSTSLTILGFDREEIIGKQFSDFIAPEYVDAFLKGSPLLRAVGQIHSEFQMLRKNGSRRFIAFEGRISHDAAGGAEQTHCILTDITERKLTEEALSAKHHQLAEAQQIARVGSWVYDPATQEPVWSDEMFRIFGLEPQETAPTYADHKKLIHPEDWERFDTAVQKAVREGIGYDLEIRLLRPDGTERTIITRCQPELAADGQVIRLVGSAHDITERKRAQDARDLVARLTVLINVKGDFRQCMSELGTALRDWTGCEAVGVRLRDGDDYPYYETRGFPPEFVQEENQLCVYGPDGKVLCDGVGNPVLECMCGNILCGRFDPSKPFFTAHGSFWSNNTTALLASTSEADRQTRTRNRCNGEGYESVALIPLRSGHKVFGLLQFNDHRPDRFSPDMIAHLEDMAGNLAIALAQRQAEEDLRESEERFKLIATNTPDHIVVHDSDLRYVWVLNPQLGLTIQDMLGKTDFDILNKEEAIAVTEVKRRVLDTGNPEYLSVPLASSDGTMQHFEGSYVPRRDAQGNVDGLIGYFRNVTERKAMEDALRDSRRRLQAILDNTPALVYVKDLDGRFTLVNREFESLFGMSGKDLIGKTSHDLKDKETADEHRANDLEVMAKREPISVEEMIEEPDGVHTYYSVKFPLFGTAGEMTGVCGISTDITERKQAEEEYQTLFREMLEGFALHEIICDAQGNPVDYRFLAVNPAFERMTGLKAEDTVGRTILEVLPITEPHWIETYGKVALTGEPAFFEDYAAGLQKYFEVTAFRPAPNQFACIFADITERKQADEAIRTSEANYRTIFDTAGDAMIVHDAETGAIVDVNRKCCEMFGYTRKEMRGLSTADISAEEPAYTRENTIRWMRRAMKGRAQLFEWKGKDRTGEVFWVEISLKRATISGEQRLISAVRDISERKRLEEAVAAKAFWEGIAQTMWSGLVVMAPNGALSYANEAFYNLVGYSKDELVGTPPPYPWMDALTHDDPLLSKEETRYQHYFVCHKSGRRIPVAMSVSDLKDEQGNIISRFAVYQDISALVAMEEQLARNERLAMLGQLAGSIGHELRNPLGVVQSSVYYLRSKLKDRDEKIDRHLDRLENSVAFSDKVITDLLSFARMPNLVKRPMAMGVFMNKLLEEFVANEKVNAVVNVESDNNIMADETQMIQLFRNLISNAHDAMPDGGQLSISIRPSAEEVMEIGVSDTGQGMTEEVLAKAFEPLYTTKARGAGFGLAICKKIVESHGGTISITSEPGKGTRVLVSLPM